jgi:hypothetical protein
VVALDALTGAFLESIAYPEPVPFFAVDRDRLPRLLADGLPVRRPIEEARDRILSQLMRDRDGRIRSPRHVRATLDLELARLIEPPERAFFRREEVMVHPLMAWHPCGEASSLLYPSFVISTPRKTIYARAADGRLTTEDDCLPFDARVLGS